MKLAEAEITDFVEVKTSVGLTDIMVEGLVEVKVV
jgi:hypothetical protein